MKPFRLQIVIAALALGSFAPSASAQVEAVAAQPQAGAVAAILGSMHVDRSSGEIPLRVGDRLLVGDRVRTHVGDRAKIVLADDAVIDIGSNTEVLIETQRLDAKTGESESVLILTDGRVRAVAPPQPGGATARFEVETPAAVAFRGTEFLISYDTATETSQVLALAGPVSVAGKLGVVGGVVEVEPGSDTEIHKGRLPGVPQETNAEALEHLRSATAVMGTGRQDGLDVLHPALTGKLLSPDDVPGARATRVAQGLQIGPVGEFLAAELSADVRTNTQPLLEYKRRNPGVPSATGVEVDF